ncbi:MAG TPA: hypothetical protein VKB46_01660 [Pyrinomonadaceae bacterium]|nr:hypothetical protein [Pyrinomonadaceae bacterium]
MPSLSGKVKHKVQRAAQEATRAAASVVVNQVKWKVDARVKYPCYKSLDEFIDVERLVSLDKYLTELIGKRIEKHDELFDTGALTRKPFARTRPGSRIIYLAKSVRPYRYTDLNKPELWARTEESEEFSLLMDFIGTLPFKKTARMMIMYDNCGRAVTAHRDHPYKNTCHEFIWFRSNKNKPFYVLNPVNNEKRYVDSYSAWFDTCNQFHGADLHGGLAFSIRVDGTFTDEFHKIIPVPVYNRASTAALWACTSH